MELLLVVAQHGAQPPLRREMPVLLEILADAFRSVTPQHLIAARQPPPPPPPKQPAAAKPAAPAAPAATAATSQNQQQQQQAAKPAGVAAAHAKRPGPAAFHPTGGRQQPAAAAPLGAAPTARGAAKPPALDSAVQQQLRRQQLAAAAKLRNAAPLARHAGFGGRFVAAHADEPGSRRTFLASSTAAAQGGVSKTLAVKEQIVDVRGGLRDGGLRGCGGCDKVHGDVGVYWLGHP